MNNDSCTDRKWTLLQVFNQIEANTEGSLETVYKVVGERVRRYVWRVVGICCDEVITGSDIWGDEELITLNRADSV